MFCRRRRPGQPTPNRVISAKTPPWWVPVCLVPRGGIVVRGRDSLVIPGFLRHPVPVLAIRKARPQDDIIPRRVDAATCISLLGLEDDLGPTVSAVVEVLVGVRGFAEGNLVRNDP